MDHSLYLVASGLSEGSGASNLPLVLWDEVKSIVTQENLLVDVLVMFTKNIPSREAL
jgi:hypothetical protein